jgi:hypothetical protein
MNKEVTMYKLVALVAVVAALAVPANAIGKRSPQPRVQVNCSEKAVFLPGRSYAICDGRFWMRQPQTRQVVAVPFWRLQQPNDPNRP